MPKYRVEIYPNFRATAPQAWLDLEKQEFDTYEAARSAAADLEKKEFFWAWAIYGEVPSTEMEKVVARGVEEEKRAKPKPSEETPGATYIYVHTMAGTVDPAEVTTVDLWSDAWSSLTANVEKGPSEGQHDHYHVYDIYGNERAAVEILWEDRILRTYGLSLEDREHLEKTLKDKTGEEFKAEHK